MARTPPSTSTERSRTDVIVAIAGAHGKIALRVTRLLTADGDSVIGTLSANGPQEVVLDMPKRGRVAIPATGIVAMRRISFTER